MINLLSPSYSHDKLENPSYVDYVDVFEDLWVNSFFNPIHVLLNTPHADMAAMTLMTSYFEAIDAYKSGKDTNGKSKKHFIESFCHVFSSNTSDIEKGAQEIYKYIRCGLVHEGMLGHKVNYSRDGAKPFYLTYPRRNDGTLNTDTEVVSIVVNPKYMFNSIVSHFKKYLSELRQAKDEKQIEAFLITIDRCWKNGANKNIIGITEEEFLGN